MSMTVIIECISWLINVTDINDAWWNPVIYRAYIKWRFAKTLLNSLCSLYSTLFTKTEIRVSSYCIDVSNPYSEHVFQFTKHLTNIPLNLNVM